MCPYSRPRISTTPQVKMCLIVERQRRNTSFAGVLFAEANCAALLWLLLSGLLSGMTKTGVLCIHCETQEFFVVLE